MRDSETGDPARSHGPDGEPSDQAFSDDAAERGGAFADVATVFALIGASVRDTARLLGLETRLVVKTVVMMVVLGVVLGLVLVGVWLSVTLIVAAGLYEFTRLGVTLSVAAASLVNLGCAGVLLLVLRRLAGRLAFPETRLAVRTLLDDASRTMRQQE
ncbi:hypothetical protein [Aquisalimonas asiatica]|uniref:Holin-X, holin superfamily III n=1 Tax=Aquisalimonas asiatica TaxID=406100 RepID=A0A1H8Q2L1_9GAMM|nr:hypothetical protein [Aquisalimonas asiatica]SEO48485.1 hypothetical protein SAMN04488052_101314 [Aquisalimonas asiatica]